MQVSTTFLNMNYNSNHFIISMTKLTYYCVDCLKAPGVGLEPNPHTLGVTLSLLVMYREGVMVSMTSSENDNR
jgi:hypothetical protein